MPCPGCQVDSIPTWQVVWHNNRKRFRCRVCGTLSKRNPDQKLTAFSQGVAVGMGSLGGWLLYRFPEWKVAAGLVGMVILTGLLLASVEAKHLTLVIAEDEPLPN